MGINPAKSNFSAVSTKRGEQLYNEQGNKLLAALIYIICRDFGAYENEHFKTRPSSRMSHIHLKFQTNAKHGNKAMEK